MLTLRSRLARLVRPVANGFSLYGSCNLPRRFISIRSPYKTDRVMAALDRLYPPADGIDLSPTKDEITNFKSMMVSRRPIDFESKQGVRPKRQSKLDAQRRSERKAFPAHPSHLNAVRHARKIEEEKLRTATGRKDPDANVPEALRHILREADEEDPYSPDLIAALNREELNKTDGKRKGRENEEYEAAMIERMLVAEPEYRQRRIQALNAISDGLCTPETNYPRKDESEAKWVDPKGFRDKLRERRRFMNKRVFETVGDDELNLLRLESQILERKAKIMEEKVDSLRSTVEMRDLKARFPGNGFLQKLREKLSFKQTIDKSESSASLQEGSDDQKSSSLPTTIRRSIRRSIRYLQKFGSTRATASEEALRESRKPEALSMHSLYPPILRNPPGTGDGTAADFGLVSASDKVAEFRREIMSLRNSKRWREAYGISGVDDEAWHKEMERAKAYVEMGRDWRGELDVPFKANAETLEHVATNHTGWNDADATPLVSQKEKFELMQQPRVRTPKSALLNLHPDRELAMKYKNAGLLLGGAPQSSFRPRFMSDVPAFAEKPLGAVIQADPAPVPKTIKASTSSHAFVQTPISKLPYLTFARLGAAPHLWPKLHEAGFHIPTAIQLASLPYLLPRRAYNPDFRPPPSFRDANPSLPRYFDAILQDLTGSGKTLAYLLPAIQSIDVKTNAIQSIIICPTRELCVQVHQQAAELARSTRTKAGEVKVARLNGKVSFPVYTSFRNHPPQLLVTTPSSLLELMQSHKSRHVRDLFAQRSTAQKRAEMEKVKQEGGIESKQKLASFAVGDVVDSKGRIQKSPAQLAAENQERAYIDDYVEESESKSLKSSENDFVILEGDEAEAYSSASSKTERDALVRNARRREMLKRLRNEKHALQHAEKVSLRGVLLPHEQDPNDSPSDGKKEGWVNLSRETPLMRKDLRTELGEAETGGGVNQKVIKIIRPASETKGVFYGNGNDNMVESEWIEDSKMRKEDEKIAKVLASKTRAELLEEEKAAMTLETRSEGVDEDGSFDDFDESDYEVVHEQEDNDMNSHSTESDDPRWWHGNFDPLIFEEEFSMAAARRKIPSALNFEQLRFVAIDEADLCMYPPSVTSLVSAMAHIRLVREDQIARGLMTLPSPKSHFPYERSPVRTVAVTATVTPALIRFASTFFLDPHAISAFEARASLNSLEHNYRTCITPILRINEKDSNSSDLSQMEIDYSGSNYIFPRTEQELTKAVSIAEKRILKLQRRRILPKSVRHFRMFYPVPEQLYLSQYLNRPRIPPEEWYQIPKRVKSFQKKAKDQETEYNRKQRLSERLEKLETLRRNRMQNARGQDAEEQEDKEDNHFDSMKEDELARFMKLQANMIARIHASLQTKGGILVFSNNTVHFEELARALECKGFRVGTMLRDSDKSARHLCLKLLAIGKLDILLASNMVARGVDVQGVGMVVNLGLPLDPMWYIHRAGRIDRMSGRQGSIVLTLLPHVHKKLPESSKSGSALKPKLSKLNANVLMRVQNLIGKHIDPVHFVKGKLELVRSPGVVVEGRAKSKAAAALKRSDDAMEHEMGLRAAGKLSEGEQIEIDLDVSSIDAAECERANQESSEANGTLTKSMSLSEANDVYNDEDETESDYGETFDIQDESNATSRAPSSASFSSPTRISIISKREVSAWQEEQPMWRILHSARQITVERTPDEEIREKRKELRRRDKLEERRRQRLQTLLKLERIAKQKMTAESAARDVSITQVSDETSPTLKGPNESPPHPKVKSAGVQKEGGQEIDFDEGRIVENEDESSKSSASNRAALRRRMRNRRGY